MKALDTARFQSIREIHDAFDRGEFLPSELTRAYLQAAQAGTLNAFITFTEENAMRAAVAADQVLKAEKKVPRAILPLFGIPLGLKDNLVTEGVRTTCASRMLENYHPPYSATVVKRLENAGAFSLGKLNMDEFAMGGSNENSAFGAVQHPTHPDRVPGGSSGGSAAAVRAGQCVASLGSDTGGSIRLPASYCGVVGLKPTYGRVSRFGLIAFASSLDQIGPLGRSVEDCAVLMDVMAGHDPLDSTSLMIEKPSCVDACRRAPDWAGLRVGIPEEFFSAQLSPGVETRVREALKWFEAQGAKLVPVTLPNSRHAVAVYYLVAVSEASSNLARFDGVRYGNRSAEAAQASKLKDFYEHARAAFGPEVKRRLILGTFALSSGYQDAYYRKACQVRALVAHDFERAFQEVDLIAGPVAPTTAFRIGEKAGDPLTLYLNDLLTIPANLAGLPAMSVPCGDGEDGLPVGLQLMGPSLSEEMLFSVGAAYERGRRQT
ncbi:MAG: glutaminyl-tRNA synthase (glutamine-hydrolyzing) subunit A [Bdellovibrionales bacterium GWB1_55_8]|nr:MAG: glutaminyl-tRNA synthase (glutamine-hydrolyzing) subunit A [Bdellovibrionales bacterium GWB1_55_8]